MASNQTAGDVPGATRLEITNTYNDTDRLDMLWIGQNFTNPTNLAYILQAEDATGASATEDFSSSGGNYVQFNLASGAETD